MQSLAPVIGLALVTSVLLLVVNLNLYVSFGNRFLLRWALAWLFYSVRFGFDLMRYIAPWEYWSVLVQIMAVVSAMFLMFGASEFLPERDAKPRWWLGVGVAVVLWPIVATVAGLSFMAMAMPPFIFVGIVDLAIALEFYRSRSLDLQGRWIAIVAFTLWGLHKFDYPFLRPIPGAGVWGYAVGAMLAVSAGVGLLIIYLSAERSRAQASESRFKSLVESLEDVVFTLDSQGRHTGVFGTWIAREQIDPSSFLGRSAIDQMGDAAGAIHVESAREVFETNKGLTYEWEQSGEDGVRSFQTTLSPIRDSQGTCIEIVGVAREVTRLKKAHAEVSRRLEEKEVLLREVHHRVKNNLQVMGSLLSLQSRELDDDRTREAFRVSIERVHTLSDVHDVLYNAEDVSGVNVGDLLSALIRRIYHSPANNELVLRIDENLGYLDLDSAVTLSLIVNELTAAATIDVASVAEDDDAVPEYMFEILREGRQLVFDVRCPFYAGRRDSPPIDGLRNIILDALVAQIGAQLQRLVGDGATRVLVPVYDD